jgi:tetratricopeptide (TPR) repeat protein
VRRPARRRGAWLALALLLAAAWPRPAVAAEDLFAAANAHYAAQRYDEAAGAYERLLDAGVVHEALHYNLANAHFRAGRLGPAILHYERALRLAPELGDARFNLEVARETAALRFGKDTIAGVARDPFWVRAVEWLSLGSLSWLFLALDVVFFGLLIALRFLPTGLLRTGLVVGNVFVGVTGALVGILLAGQLYLVRSVPLGVVVADEVVMREGPDPTRREMPKLHAGHRIVLLQEREGWTRVRLSNRVEGWVPREAVERI